MYRISNNINNTDGYKFTQIHLNIAYDAFILRFIETNE